MPLLQPILKTIYRTINYKSHWFKHGFQDSFNSVYRCGTNVESCVHYFLHRLLFQNERLKLLSIVKNIDSKLLDYSDSSKRFEEPLFWAANFFFFFFLVQPLR